MASCPVCGVDLPAPRGPRPRRYCSRACQGKAYRARQRQHSVHRAAAADEPGLLARYADVPSLELADRLALAARRLAGALTAGQGPDDADLDLLARIPVVLAARARRAVPMPAATVRPGTETSRDDTGPARARPAMPAAKPGQGTPAGRDAPTEAVVDMAARRKRSAATGTETARNHAAQGAPDASPVARIARTSRDDPAAAAPAPRGIELRPQKLAKKKARAVVDAAELVRHPEHRDNHQWILRSGDTVLGYVEPTYGGASRSGRNGWTGRLGGSRGRRCTTRDGAAADLAARWVRLVTAVPTRTLTGD
ncbi:hypothetical protein [Streptomyces cahuitamycinicus]|uniref:Uncharacterized protein n=1 Tax=Streptomyces cahuitamycinicus TaxID=2070367 RepID=A0A2N8TSD6_9ACTN|nr:hypothetical protein [Streptomyces cahuitamycinicus]PNG21893.1 hypothetical protein C1J00_12355 [Streptomyces cahuitamycinicus]